MNRDSIIAMIVSAIIKLAYQYDQLLTSYLQSNSFTSNLLATPISKLITEFLIIVFIVLFSYETIYWSGIYLKLWDYHAKDIFTEVPIHCSHVYIRLNFVDSENIELLDQYYQLKSNSTILLSKFHDHFNFNVKFDLAGDFNNWKKLNSLSREVFKLQKFIKYYFEFSPEDFEMNEEPEFGSTIIHLRGRVLNLINDSEYLRQFNQSSGKKSDNSSDNNKNELTVDNVKIYNNKNIEVGTHENDNYLSKCNIETGNTIDVVVVI